MSANSFLSLTVFLSFIIFSFIAIPTTIAQNDINIAGVVQNGLDGKPIRGVNVVLKGTTISTITDNDGRFILNLSNVANCGLSIQKLGAKSNLFKKNKNLDLILTIEKDYYHRSDYKISDNPSNIIIQLLPKLKSFGIEDYSSSFLPFTKPIMHKVQWENIIDGVRLFHEKRLKSLISQRELYWNRNLTSAMAYDASVEPNRENLRKIVGAVDQREPILMEKLNKVAETNKYIAYEVKWPVLKEITPRPYLQEWPELDLPTKIFGEGLLLEPKSASKGFVVAIPDADQEPESLIGLKDDIDKNSQFARYLVENGYTVVVPVIIDRTNRWSRGTDRTSRSWIYAQTYEMGRTVTGYEIQKIEALIDWFYTVCGNNSNIGVAGYGEGGLLAFYTAALDTRINVALVSGYFAPREEIWKEPIYRNMWGLLKEFGDAEIASLIAPRSLVIEYSKVPEYDNELNSGKKIEPPANLWTHTFKEVKSEFNRIASLTGKNIGSRVLITNQNGSIVPFGSSEALDNFIKMLGNNSPLPISDDTNFVELRKEYDYAARMERMVEQMVGHTQLLLRDSEYVRNEFVKEWSERGQEELRYYFKEEMTGWTYDDFLPINPKSKLVESNKNYNCYEVLLDVLPNIEMWGVLLLPNNIKSNEKRPLIVMQHGRGGNPYTALDEGGTYYGIARRLTEKGFVVFTPFGNWTGETRFRWIDRIARPAKNTIWSTVGKQHQQLLRWFKTLPFVDSDRIAIYGKSIGGQASSIIAAMIPEYALSINCAYFNEGARKMSSVYYPTSFVFHVDSEMPMWNRGHKLEHAELANKLIFPRPFMVEHGKKDGIAPFGWVEHEYSKVKEHYIKQNRADFTDLDHHEGGHIINKVKTIPFLQKHLKWSVD